MGQQKNRHCRFFYLRLIKEISLANIRYSVSKTKLSLVTIHFFLIVAMAVLTKASLFYLSNEFCVEFLNWYDLQKPLTKFLIIVLTSLSLMSTLLIFSYPLQWLRNHTLGMLPINGFIERTYSIVLLINLICGLIYAWVTLPNANYWTLVEMTLISMSLIQLNWFFLYEKEEKPD